MLDDLIAAIFASVVLCFITFSITPVVTKIPEQDGKPITFKEMMRNGNSGASSSLPR